MKENVLLSASVERVSVSRTAPILYIEYSLILYNARIQYNTLLQCTGELFIM